MPRPDTEEGRERNAAYQRKWYRNNRKLQVARVSERRRVVGKFVKYMKHWARCPDCDTRYPYWKMDFDHVRGKKRFNLGAARSVGTMGVILKEIEKCDIVCANCHRDRTYRAGQAAPPGGCRGLAHPVRDASVPG